MKLSSKTKKDLKLLEALVSSPDNKSIILAICEDDKLKIEILGLLKETLLKHSIGIHKIDISRDHKNSHLNLIKEIRDFIPTEEFREIVGGFKNVLLFVDGLEILDEEQELMFIKNLNIMRDDFTKIPYPVIIQLNTRLIDKVARKAPDFWSWRSAVYEFEVAKPEPRKTTKPSPAKKRITLTQAQNIKEVINALANPFPLDNSFSAFYCPCPDGLSSFERLDFKINISSKPLKFVFSGPQGSGKSTGLWKLADNLAESHIVINIPVRDWVNSLNKNNDLLTLLMLSLISNEVLQRGITLPVNCLGFIKALAKGIYSRTTASSSFIYNPSEHQILTDFSSNMKLTYAKTGHVAAYLQNNILSVIETLNNLIAEIERVTSKKILLVIDDLDKIGPEITDKIFLHSNNTITDLCCTIICNCPTRYFYETDIIKQIEQTFDDVYFINYVRTLNRDGELCTEGVTFLKDLIRKRVSDNMIDDQALTRAVLMTGGNIHNLLKFIANAALRAIVNGNAEITLREVDETVLNIKAHYFRLLTKEDSGILEDINSDNYFIQEYERVRFFHLLSNNFIIEYHDDNSSWYAVHPIIKLILDQNKKEETFIA